MRYSSENLNKMAADIEYNQDLGILIHKSTGDAITTGNCGYIRFQYKGLRYYAHRVIYVLEHGDIDSDDIVDHIDGNRRNNHISNLRKCHAQANSVNRHVKPSHNESGWPWVRKPVKGVFRYYFTCKGTVYSLSGFDSAVAAYAAGRKHHKRLNGCYTPSLEHLTHEQLLEYVQFIEKECDLCPELQKS